MKILFVIKDPKKESWWNRETGEWVDEFDLGLCLQSLSDASIEVARNNLHPCIIDFYYEDGQKLGPGTIF